MNFLSHYYIDRSHPSEYFKLGVIFPDLIRNSNPKIKLREIANSPGSQFPETANLEQGILRHFEVDKWFHNSAFFKEHSGNLKLIFRQNGFDRKELRLFFLSHILTEIILDRLLLIHEPGLGDHFYNDLGKVDTNHVARLFLENPNYDHVKFSESFSRFLESRYLLSYSKTEAIFYAINRISRRLSLEPFGENDFAAFEKCILESEKQMRNTFLQFFNELI